MSDQDTSPAADDQPPATPEPEVNNGPDLSELLSTIKNGSGEPKYADAATALQSINPAQDHIKKLEDDNKALTEGNAKLEAEKVATEDLLKQIKDAQQAGGDTPPVENALDATTITTLVDNHMKNSKEQERLDSNVAALDAKLVETFGSKEAAMAKVSETAKTLGVSDKDLLSLGVAQSPEVVYKLMGVEDKKPTTPNPVNGGNIQMHNDPTPDEELSGAELFAKAHGGGGNNGSAKVLADMKAKGYQSKKRFGQR